PIGSGTPLEARRFCGTAGALAADALTLAPAAPWRGRYDQRDANDLRVAMDPITRVHLARLRSAAGRPYRPAGEGPAGSRRAPKRRGRAKGCAGARLRAPAGQGRGGRAEARVRPLSVRRAHPAGNSRAAPRALCDLRFATG